MCVTVELFLIWTNVARTNVTWTNVTMTVGICFWWSQEPTFKSRLLGPSWTDSNCQGDICPGNICPGDICPYQEYLSCYRVNFDQTLMLGLKFLEAKIFCIQNFLDPKFFWTLIFWTTTFLDLTLFDLKFFAQSFFGHGFF